MFAQFLVRTRSNNHMLKESAHMSLAEASSLKSSIEIKLHKLGYDYRLDLDRWVSDKTDNTYQVHIVRLADK